MPEYIEREAVMKTAKDGNHSDFERSMADLTSLREVLEDTPAEYVVKVVRCKNCAHRDKAGLCQAEGQKLTIVKDDHFCGKGERRDNSG